MSCFAVATAWLFAAEALMVAGFGFPAVDIAAPDTLVLVQIIAIGWLSLCVCGALTQFVPVLVGKPVYSEAAALPVLCLLVAGLTALLLGFLALGGRLPPWLWPLPFGATLLVSGFGLLAPDPYHLARPPAVWAGAVRARRPRTPWRHGGAWHLLCLGTGGAPAARRSASCLAPAFRCTRSRGSAAG